MGDISLLKLLEYSAKTKAALMSAPREKEASRKK